MKLFKLTCPNCTANLELDAEREFGFCQYCGTKIMLDFGAPRQYVVNNTIINNYSGFSNAQPLSDIVKSILDNMVKCPAGTFIMGSLGGGMLAEFLFWKDRELGHNIAELQHRVTISRDFYIGKYPVTQALYSSIMNENPSKFKGDNKPVDSISWLNAKEFCDKLNTISSTSKPFDYVFDLPTEAQWEYACRAGTTTSLNSGNNIESTTGSCRFLDELGWYQDNSSGMTHPVGLKKPNAWGIYDMHGNVWEWCSDDHNYEYTESSVIDPKYPCSVGLLGTPAVSRGGSFLDTPELCRSANRFSRLFCPKYAIGFRLALVHI